MKELDFLNSPGIKIVATLAKDYDYEFIKNNENTYVVGFHAEKPPIYYLLKEDGVEEICLD